MLGAHHDLLASDTLADVVRRDADRDVRREAFLALASFADPATLPALFTFLNVPREYGVPELYAALDPMREAALAHLLAALEDPATRSIYARRLSWHAAYLTTDDTSRLSKDPLPPSLLHAALNLCSDADPALRNEALRTLYRQDDSCVTATAFAALHDEDAAVRRTAALLLSRRHTDMALLRAYLADANPQVRAAALAAVPWEVRKTPAYLAGVLLPATFDTSAMVRVAALRQFRDRWYIEDGPEPEELPPWRERLPALLADADASVRAQALFAAALVDLPALPEAVTAAVDDSDPSVREAARMLLAGFVEDHDVHPGMPYAANALVECHAPRLLECLSRALAHAAYARAMDEPDLAVAQRARAFSWFVLTEEERATCALTMAHDPWQELRWMALVWLQQLQHPHTADMARQALNDPVRDVQRAALRVLIGLEGDEGLALIRQILCDRDEETAYFALGVMRGRATPADVPLLLPFLFHRHWFTRLRARVALRHATGVDCGFDVAAWLAWQAHRE
jgi:HEAT repeat protein